MQSASNPGVGVGGLGGLGGDLDVYPARKGPPPSGAPIN